VPQNAVTATDQQLDALVNELYGLTAAEIKLVEAGKRKRQLRFVLPPGVARARRATLGIRVLFSPNFKEVVSPSAPNRHNPVGVENQFASFTQGSHVPPTLGWATKPRWGKPNCT
jgi:hypothetical protein